MDIEVTHLPGARTGEFVIERDGTRLGRMNYSRHAQRAEILHTEVDPALRGTGAGKKLVAAAVDWARSENVTIVPLCSYAKSVFAKTPEFGDVL
jgi:uncharacterized protein